MSRELFILRHAEAELIITAGQDSTRTLNKQGRKDAQRIGAWMREHYLYPGQVYCSSATRARETLEIIAAELELKAESIEFRDDLYLASSSGLLKFLGDIPGDYNSVMLVGHNPGLQELVGMIGDSSLSGSKAGKLLPTACLVQFKLPDTWDELAGKAELVRVIRPSELEE